VIVEEGSSYRIERDESGDTLVVTDSWTPQISQLMADGRADGLDLNYAKGFKDTDLEILRDWPVKRLAVLARTIKDLSPVLRLAGTLEVLSVQTAPKALIDLGQFPVLTVMAAEWSQIRSTISEAPRLRDLMVRAYDEADLEPLRWNTALTRLRFKDRPRLRHLSGVEVLRSLEHLGVYLAPLQDLDALGNEDFALRELHVESCPIRDLSPLARQHKLTLLNASDCGDLASLSPLRELSDLSILWLFGTTRVVDDDLSPLCELPHLRELRMRSRRSYRPSVEAIQALCAERDQ
jgi:hypothetical protein